MNLTLRWAYPEDCEYFYQLRCDPAACAMSRRPAPTREEHDRWWHTTGEYRLVGVDHDHGNGYIVGTLRVNPDGMVSIIVDPACRGRGYGTEMLKLLPKVMGVCGYKRLLAEIAPENERSQQAFKKAGWVPVLFEVACV